MGRRHQRHSSPLISQDWPCHRYSLSPTATISTFPAKGRLTRSFPENRSWRFPTTTAASLPARMKPKRSALSWEPLCSRYRISSKNTGSMSIPQITPCTATCRGGLSRFCRSLPRMLKSIPSTRHFWISPDSERQIFPITDAP